MNTRLEAEQGIVQFLKSKEQGLLLTGTHQYEKHKLVLKTIVSMVKQPISILFRTNAMQMIGTHFRDRTKQYKTGVNYGYNNCELYFDSFKTTSWNHTKNYYDIAIIYPIDALIREANLRERVLTDIYERDINKIFLVSWTDRPEYDYSIINNYYSQHIIFDAFEEDNAYHNRVLGLHDK